MFINGTKHVVAKFLGVLCTLHTQNEQRLCIACLMSLNKLYLRTPLLNSGRAECLGDDGLLCEMSVF